MSNPISVLVLHFCLVYEIGSPRRSFVLPWRASNLFATCVLLKDRSSRTTQGPSKSKTALCYPFFSRSSYFWILGPSNLRLQWDFRGLGERPCGKFSSTLRKDGKEESQHPLEDWASPVQLTGVRKRHGSRCSLGRSVGTAQTRCLMSAMSAKCCGPVSYRSSNAIARCLGSLSTHWTSQHWPPRSLSVREKRSKRSTSQTSGLLVHVRRNCSHSHGCP